MIIDPQKAQDGEQLLSPQSPDQTPSLHPNYPPNHLHLDPGPKKRASRGITLRCLCFAIASLVIFVAVMIMISFVRGLFIAFSRPHSKLYQNPKSGIVSGPTVVKPLIGKKGELGGLFDVRATVWIRDKAHASETRASGIPVHDGGGLEERQQVSETVLFSKTVFSGVSLKDNKVQTDIDLQIPTDIFKQAVLHDTDLRASFILIPNTPSLLDYAVNFSTVNPKTLVPPVRQYPLDYEPTLTDNIIDSYGISVQLLEFHPIQSKCKDSLPIETDPSDEFPMDDLDVPLESTASPKEKAVDYEAPFVRPKSTIGFDVLESHPYIISRTFLKVVDMTQLYINKGYDEQHKKLKATKMACRTDKQIGSTCERVFQTHGNFETKIRLQGSDGKKTGHEWAYAPFMAPGKKTYGPLDLIPAPVNRENCAVGKDGVRSLKVEDELFVNVTWHLTYSGRSPGKAMYSDVISEVKRLNMTATDEEKKVAQWEYALYQGMMGHPYRNDFHPRRQLALDVIGQIFGFIQNLLSAYYFYALSSTVGLSTIGTTLIGSAWLLDYVLSAIARAHRNNSDAFEFLWNSVFGIIPQIPAILMLKAALRAELEWTRGGILKVVPRVRFSPPTHRERVSRRIESRIPLSWTVGAFCLMGTVQHFLPLREYYLISPRNIIKPPAPVGLDAYFQHLQTYLVIPSIALGKLLQISHNHFSRTFAGTYKTAVWASAISLFFSIMGETATVVGYRDVYGGFPLALFIMLIIESVDVLQAWVYPAVVHFEESDH